MPSQHPDLLKKGPPAPEAKAIKVRTPLIQGIQKLQKKRRGAYPAFRHLSTQV